MSCVYLVFVYACNTIVRITVGGSDDARAPGDANTAKLEKILQDNEVNIQLLDTLVWLQTTWIIMPPATVHGVILHKAVMKLY